MSLTPDQEIAQHNFQEFHKQQYPKMPADNAFELFAAGLLLKTFGLEPADLRRGIVGQTNDGGVDAIYLILNRTELVESDSIRLSRRRNYLNGLQPGVALDIVILQSKNSPKWDSEAFPKLRDVIEAMLDESMDAAALRGFPLNDDVIEKTQNLRTLRKKLLSLVPTITFHVYYASLAKQGEINDYRETKRKGLETWLKGKMPIRSRVIVKYVGDSEITRLLLINNDFTARLKFAKTPVRETSSFIGLVPIRDYLSFIRRPKSKDMLDEMFAVNVRDFAGQNVRVNAAIKDTLAHDSKSAFWWLNNGVTIIADRADDPAETEWVLTNPMIVNGLQTSHVLHTAELAGEITRKRSSNSLLVRVITESDPGIREAVITGTNNQTSVAALQLHANEEVHIRIERYLRAKGWYYERRRYQYRGTTAPAARIRNMTELGQAMMAVHLLEPGTARARPNTLLSKPAGYKSIFSDELNLGLYLKSLTLMENVETYLATAAAKKISDDATNVRFYLASGYVIRSLGLKTLTGYSGARNYAQIKPSPLVADLQEVHKMLQTAVAKLDDGKIARDKIFKGNQLQQNFFDALIRRNKRGN